MKTKTIVKIAVDVLMTVGLLFQMGYHLWGDAAHEWAGASMLALYIAHHLLNHRWYKGLRKGRFSPARVLQICVNMLLLLTMAAQMYSGITMSRHVFLFLPFKGGMSLARRLHILGAYWGMVLMSIHLGLHWQMLLGMAKMRRKGKPSKARSILFFIIGLAIAVYGFTVFIQRDFTTYMLLRSEFVFMDFSESVVLFYLDYAALMGLWVFVSHYLMKGLRKIKGRTPKEEI